MNAKSRILVVEDFGSIRNFICETLQRKGYETLDAPNGAEAFTLLNQMGSSVNLVITDYNMPDGTGYDLLLKIKRTPATANIPVIFLTTESHPDKMREARDAGLAAWVKKPYRAEAFFSQIERAIRPGVESNIQ